LHVGFNKKKKLDNEVESHLDNFTRQGGTAALRCSTTSLPTFSFWLNPPSSNLFMLHHNLNIIVHKKVWDIAMDLKVQP
jgi:hypothetical protein